VVSLLNHARWAQQVSGGKLTLFAVLPEGGDDVIAIVTERLRTHLLPLVDESGADIQVLAGEPFVEIIRRVLRAGHDLVMVSARRHGSHAGSGWCRGDGCLYQGASGADRSTDHQPRKSRSRLRPGLRSQCGAGIEGECGGEQFIRLWRP
jgi:hypothetical protein